MDFCAFWRAPKLISRKIWIIEKSWNFHTVLKLSNFFCRFGLFLSLIRSLLPYIPLPWRLIIICCSWNGKSISSGSRISSFLIGLWGQINSNKKTTRIKNTAGKNTIKKFKYSSWFSGTFSMSTPLWFWVRLVWFIFSIFINTFVKSNH